MKRAYLLAILMLACFTAGPATAARGDAPFVVTYRCDGGRWLAVGYPAFKDAGTATVRLSWQGRTVQLAPTRTGSGARYINARANLEWWSKGKGGTLSRLGPSRPLATGCAEA